MGLVGFIIFVPGAGHYRCEGSKFWFSFSFLMYVSRVHVVSFVICLAPCQPDFPFWGVGRNIIV